MSKNRYEYATIKGIKKRVHTIIMEDHIGRELNYDEHVYHKDGNCKNNSIENLVVIKKNFSNTGTTTPKGN